MATVIRTSSRNTYTTLLTPITRQPSASLERVAHHDSPSPSPSDQAEQQFSSLESRKAHDTLKELNDLSPNWQDMGDYKALLTSYLMSLDLLTL
jgi:hypothetical protein